MKSHDMMCFEACVANHPSKFAGNQSNLSNIDVYTRFAKILRVLFCVLAHCTRDFRILAKRAVQWSIHGNSMFFFHSFCSFFFVFHTEYIVHKRISCGFPRYFLFLHLFSDSVDSCDFWRFHAFLRVFHEFRRFDQPQRERSGPAQPLHSSIALTSCGDAR